MGGRITLPAGRRWRRRRAGPPRNGLGALLRRLGARLRPPGPEGPDSRPQGHGPQPENGGALKRRLAPLNPAARLRARRASAEMMALAMTFHDEYAATGEIVFALVYRLEAAGERLAAAVDAVSPRLPGEPAGELRLMATALAETVHLAQLAREWRQDAINLRHGLEHGAHDGARRAAVEAGVRQLEAYVRQNMSDFSRWLAAAQRLNPAAARAAAALRRRERELA
ncbi:hypothetical protein ACFFJB_03480 [Camelimonas abortus]|uniref:hypothetical protein n=1 Tax=Camelimonas abortus TaxID=1017184 RepID=UPI0035EEB614